MTRPRLMKVTHADKKAPTKSSRRLTPSLPQLWALVVLAGIFVILSLLLVRPHDFWWHVRTGQWIVENGRVPAADIFSYTRAGEPYAFALWWLTEVTLYLLLNAGGLPLVVFAHAVVITVAYCLLLRTVRPAAGGNLRWAALVTLGAAALGLEAWNVRPQSISFLFFALTLLILERYATHRAGTQGGPLSWWLWLFPPLFAVWANAHGAFVLGLALVGCHFLAALLAWLRRRASVPTPLMLVIMVSAFATLLNPLGPGIVKPVLGIFRHPGVRTLTVEWMSTTIRTRGGLVFFLLLAGLLALLLTSGYRPKPREWFRLLLFGCLALLASRNTVWFGFIAAPTAAACLHHWSSIRGAVQETGQARSRNGQPAVNLLLAALIGLLFVLSLPWFRSALPLAESRRKYISPETPVRAVDFLRTLTPPVRAFHSEAAGSYMIWASQDVPVFIDTRIELYPAEQWTDYLAASGARYDWEVILDRYGIDTLLLQRGGQQPLIEAASASARWQILYEDDQAIIFRRGGTP